MAVEEIEIDSIQDFVTKVEDNSGTYNGAIWYRGQSDAAWDLKPSYLRLDSNTRPEEDALLAAFRQNANMLLIDKPKTDFDWLFLMQHYGVPTRLLDWSESPLIALYFAVDNLKSDTDCAIWTLKPTELNRHAKMSINHDFYIPSTDDEHIVTTYSKIQHHRLNYTPVATIATRNSARMQAQWGVFTIHHLDETPINDINNGVFTAKYIVRPQNKEKIKKQLHLLGINRFLLFPELGTVKDVMKQRGLL